jgi:hypothetical protein
MVNLSKALEILFPGDKSRDAAKLDRGSLAMSNL